MPAGKIFVFWQTKLGQKYGQPAPAGGVETLLNLNKALPSDFHASVFVVVHFPAFSMSLLADILNRNGNLTAKHVEDGERFTPGNINISPPNSHLAFNDHTFILAHGPREHGFRLAIDTLGYWPARGAPCA